MKETKIKSIDEYFSQSLGDSFNSSNGVFKVDYRAYSDLSLPIGRGPDPSLLIKDSVYKNGDLVKGKVKGKKRKIEGEVIETNKSADGKFYIIKIQTFKDKKKYTLIPGSIEFIQDRGNSTNMSTVSIDQKEKNAQNLKYTGGNIVWGSMEGNNIGTFYSDVESNDNIIDGPLDTGWKIKFVDRLPQEKTLFNSFVFDPKSSLIYSLRSYLVDELKNKLKAAESHCFIFHHQDLAKYSEELRSLIAILFLEMKNESEAKKYLIQYFTEINGKSYGEVRDENLQQAKDIIQKFL